VKDVYTSTLEAVFSTSTLLSKTTV